MFFDERLKPNGCYQVMDAVTPEEQKTFGLKFRHGLPSIGSGVAGIGAQQTGEFRPVRKGEWYLSGSVVEAYRAPNDLRQPYHIARLVRARVETKLVVG